MFVSINTYLLFWKFVRFSRVTSRNSGLNVWHLHDVFFPTQIWIEVNCTSMTEALFGFDMPVDVTHGGHVTSSLFISPFSLNWCLIEWDLTNISAVLLCLNGKNVYTLLHLTAIRKRHSFHHFHQTQTCTDPFLSRARWDPPQAGSCAGNRLLKLKWNATQVWIWVLPQIVTRRRDTRREHGELLSLDPHVLIRSMGPTTGTHTRWSGHGVLL